LISLGVIGGAASSLRVVAAVWLGALVKKHR
jgi:hypothetical protein